MKKNYFFGKYYKFVAEDGFAFALIDSYADDGKKKQIITPAGGFNIIDLEAVSVGERELVFNVEQDGLQLCGRIQLGELHPPQGKVMGPLSLFPMECSHDIYSMHHSLRGCITIDGVTHSFDNGLGYIEGDRGRSFPQKYMWYNSMDGDYSATLAIATIPFGPVSVTGVLCFIDYRGREYRLASYNFARIIEAAPQCIHVKKGQYELRITVSPFDGYELDAPTNGIMGRIVKESISVPASFVFSRRGQVLLEKNNINASVEFML